MNVQIEEQVEQLTSRRELIKKELFEKYAERARKKELYVIHGESTPFSDRVVLDSEIATLEFDRQSTKVELMRLKALAKSIRRESLVGFLIEALKANGLENEVVKARHRADEDLKQKGLFAAYASNVEAGI